MMLLSSLDTATLMQDEGQDGHSGTVAAGNPTRGDIEVSPVEIVRCDSGGDLHLRELQTQRDDGHGREAGDGSGPGIDAYEEASRKGQVKRG